MDYWEECISAAFDDVGIEATEEQIKNVAFWVEGAHENYGMAHGHDCIPNPLKVENDKLRTELTKEREKVTCEVCNGRGEITTYGLHHSASSQCGKCRGEGRCLP